MEENRDIFGMLDLQLRPGFCVKDHQILHVNPAAQGLPLSPGADIRTLLATGLEEYEDFQEGCLSLALNLIPEGCGVTVTRVDGWDIFLFDPLQEDTALQAMALSAQELRQSLSSIMIAAQRMIPLASQENPHGAEQAALLNRGMHQMLRTISNMSDAGRYHTGYHPEYQNLTALFGEILEKAQTLLDSAGLNLEFSVPDQPIFGMADAEQLERAVLNLLSNAGKASEKGGTISAALTRRGKMLRLCVQDSGKGIPEAVRGNVFQRYLRHPSLDDSLNGIGLGFVLIRSAAANHGGTVLIDQPGKTGTRVTMTIALRESGTDVLRSPILRPDYAGGWDHALVELSDCLPLQVYRPEN